MRGFAPKQVHALRGKLDRGHVQTREIEGRSIDYIEGWFAIAQANAIFDFDGWDRETSHFERLFERTRNDTIACGYLARVRIRVRAGDTTILREGTGWGSATSTHIGEAHERALKAAETDATKRALATFGNRFGLGLYDKEQNGVTPKKAERSGLCLYAPDGAALAENLSAEGFCGGLRQLIEKSETFSELQSLQQRNAQSLCRLRKEAPNLKTGKAVHYADVLERLVTDRSKTLALAKSETSKPPPFPVPLKQSKLASGPRIDKSVLNFGTERRLRDKSHLRFVAAHACLICGRLPSHAHHLTFAQKRGLSLKVSDEYAVPLCHLHHDELHRSGAEAKWWEAKGMAPLPIAAQLWTSSREQGGKLNHVSPEDPIITKTEGENDAPALSTVPSIAEIALAQEA